VAFTTALYHPMLAAAATTAVEVSLHTADPGTTGGSEVSGGDYTRLPVTWQAPANGAVRASDALVFDVPGLGSDGRVTHVGLWSGSGEWLGGIAAATPQPFPSPGTATVEPLSLDMATGVLAAAIASE
jgi:hypothetical protein